MSIRIVTGEIDARDATTRTVMPTVAQVRWPPFDRIAEVIATPRRRFPPHRHEGVEVLTHVIEGSGTYEYSTEPPLPVAQGATQLLSAPTSVAHVLNPGKGQTIRWFVVVARLPAGTLSPPRLGSSRASEGNGLQPDGTTARRLVGAGTDLRSAIGLEGEAIQFPTPGTSFRKVGHRFIAVCYVISGRGTIDNQPVEAGEAALIDNAGGIALHGQSGFHVVLIRAPPAA